MYDRLVSKMMKESDEDLLEQPLMSDPKQAEEVLEEQHEHEHILASFEKISNWNQSDKKAAHSLLSITFFKTAFFQHLNQVFIRKWR